MTTQQDLTARRCKPCEGGIPALDIPAVRDLMKALHPDWTLAADSSVEYDVSKISTIRGPRTKSRKCAWRVPMSPHISRKPSNAATAEPENPRTRLPDPPVNHDTRTAATSPQ